MQSTANADRRLLVNPSARGVDGLGSELQQATPSGVTIVNTGVRGVICHVKAAATTLDLRRRNA
jgi:hypothetical protein